MFATTAPWAQTTTSIPNSTCRSVWLTFFIIRIHKNPRLHPSSLLLGNFLNLLNRLCLSKTKLLNLSGLMRKFCSTSSVCVINKVFGAALTINLGVLELPCGDLVLKEQVDLAERAVLGFREAEPAPEVAQEVGSGVEQTSLGSPVPSFCCC